MPFTLHIDGNRTWGGGQAQSLGLALSLAERGERTYFIAEHDSALAESLAASDLPWETWPLRGLRGLLAARRLAARIRELDPDIVHIHDSASVLPAGMAARRAGPAKVVITRRTTSPLRGGWLSRLKHRRYCDHMICISEAVRRQCLAAGLPDDRLTVIPDFVDCRLFDPASVTAGRMKDDSTICAVGRLSPEKGHRVLLQAMRAVSRALPGVKLQLCGEGPERDALMRTAEEGDLSVAPLGFLRDVRPVLAAADVFAMPSLSEGLGVAVLEAMAMGKPVVTTDAGGLPEAVVQGETGLIVPAGDAAALAEALVALLRDPERAREMGRAGRERALARFDRPRVVDRVLALYNEVLGGGRG